MGNIKVLSEEVANRIAAGEVIERPVSVIKELVENSIDAKATRIKILVEENLVKDKLRITIVDNGVGMDKKNISKITDPFVTTKTCRKVGLGLPLLKVKAQQCHGDLSISSFLGKGTTIKIKSYCYSVCNR